MKKITVSMSVIILCLMFVGLSITINSIAYAKKPVLLRNVVPSPPGDWPLTYFNEEMAKRFNKRANGEYEMETHAGGALAKLPEYFDAVRIGAIEMACAPWPLYSFLDPRFGAIQSPFLFKTSTGASAACKLLFPLYDEIFQEKFNAKGLNLYNPGGMQLYSAKKPIKTLEDWDNLLVGAIDPPCAAMCKELGASPVTIVWPDLFESLQKKVIDAAITSTRGARNNFYEVIKYNTIFYGMAGWNGFTINLDVWKKMPKHIQQILWEEANIAGEWMNHIVDNVLGEEDIKKAKEMGIEVYILPKEERDRWEAQLKSYTDKYFESLGEFGKKVKRIADELNEIYPYSESGMY